MIQFNSGLELVKWLFNPSHFSYLNATQKKVFLLSKSILLDKEWTAGNNAYHQKLVSTPLQILSRRVGDAIGTELSLICASICDVIGKNDNSISSIPRSHNRLAHALASWAFMTSFSSFSLVLF